MDEKRRGSKKALYIAENFDEALSTILVGNNIVNIAAASISAKVATDLFGGSTGLVISTVGMTILILIFGEVLPKSLAKEHAESFSLLISDVLYMLIQLFTPVTALLVMLKKLVSKFVGHQADVPSVTEEEIKVMVNLSEEEGVIDNKEKELVHRSLDFNDILVGEIFTPRIDMVAVEVNQPVEEIRDIFLRERYSRVPVYEGDIDNVIGILSESDFFSQLVQGKEVNVRQLLRTPLFVVESMRISTLLPELQKSKVHMAIVIDEFGGTSGLITLEDILEQIVGEIWDEHDEAVKTFQKINDYEYEFNAELPLDEFCDILGIDELESSSHTLGGWVFEMFERIPTVGESFEYESLTVTVRQVENRRIRKVLVRIREPIVENV
nr:hemolysin family protein [Anoxybacillus sp. KU2-6(11)]